MPSLLLKFSAKCADNCFLRENTHSLNGTIDISKTQSAMAVSTQHARIPSAKLVKRVTTDNAKLSSAQRFSQANYNCHAMPTSWLPGNARVACTHAAICVGKRILTLRGVRKACQQRTNGRAHNACKRSSGKTTRNINEQCGKSSTTPSVASRTCKPLFSDCPIQSDPLKMNQNSIKNHSKIYPNPLKINQKYIKIRSWAPRGRNQASKS